MVRAFKYIWLQLETFWLFVLSHLLDMILALALRRGKPGFLNQKQKRTANLIKTSIYARLVVEGYITQGRGKNRYPEWEQLNQQLYETGSSMSADSGINDPEFCPGLEQLVGQRFSDGNKIVALINGPASFAQRYALIEDATESIFLATWKLYGDESGIKMIDALLARRRENGDVDIRVMVDGNVATRDQKSLDQLKRLVDANIPVAFYHCKERPYDGFHYKVIVVDGATAHPVAISGGMNIANEYAHAYGTSIAEDPERKMWRDTDIRVDGPGARDDYLTFIQLWNGQAARSNPIEPFGQVLTPINMPNDLPSVVPAGTAKQLITVDVPGPHSQQTVTLAMVYGIRAAQKSVDIENAYFMEVPAIRNALVDAMLRGVNVRILTNSLESVDEKVVAVPILKGLYALMEKADTSGAPRDRCEVYVRKKLRPHLVNADTLHSKFMVVDALFCQVASYNIHARSLRLEVEGAHNIVDRELGASLSAAFTRDIEDDVAYRDKDDIDFPDDMISRLLVHMNLNPVLM